MSLHVGQTPSTQLCTTVQTTEKWWEVTCLYRTPSPLHCSKTMSTGRTGGPTLWFGPTNGTEPISQCCNVLSHSRLTSRSFTLADNQEVSKNLFFQFNFMIFLNMRFLKICLFLSALKILFWSRYSTTVCFLLSSS